jgi:hypothetical protein
MDRIQRKLASVPVRTWLWLVIGLGLLARLGAVLIMGDTVDVLPGIYDQVSYHTLATRLLDGHGFTFSTEWWPVTRAGEPTAHWSYLYTFYLTAVYAVVGVHPIAARIIQILIVGILTPWLAFQLATHLKPSSTLSAPSLDGSGAPIPPIHTALSSLISRKTLIPLIAAAWIALYPYFIYYSAALMTEMFYITAILWSLNITIDIAYSHYRPMDKRIWARFSLLGMSVGIAVLLRQVYLAFVPFLWIWVILVMQRSQQKSSAPEEKGKIRLGIAITGIVGSAVVLTCMVLPFTLWNYHQFGRFVLLNTNAGYAFFWANHPVHGDDFVPLFTPEMPTYQELIPPELRTLDEAALDSELMRRGLQFVFAEPIRYLRLSLSRIDDHFIFWPKSDSSLLSNITRVTSIGLALPFMLSGAGLWLAKAWHVATGKLFPRLWAVLAQPGGLLFLFFCIYVGVHLLSWAGIRYRLPADAVLLTFAPYGLLHLVFKITYK